MAILDENYSGGLLDSSEESGNSALEIILDLDNPDSGGIFGRERASVLEASLYHRMVKRVVDLLRESETSTYQIGDKVLTKDEARAFLLGRISSKYTGPLSEGFLERWRREFIEKYGDEP